MHEMTNLGVTTGSTSGDCRVEDVEGMRGEQSKIPRKHGYIPRRDTFTVVKVTSCPRTQLTFLARTCSMKLQGATSTYNSQGSKTYTIANIIRYTEVKCSYTYK